MQRGQVRGSGREVQQWRGKSEGDWEGKESMSELFRESIWRLANSYAGIMFSELFVGPRCVCEGGTVEGNSGMSITETHTLYNSHPTA